MQPKMIYSFKDVLGVEDTYLTTPNGAPEADQLTAGDLVGVIIFLKLRLKDPRLTASFRVTFEG